MDKQELKKQKFMKKVEKLFPEFVDQIKDLNMHEVKERLLKYFKHKHEVKESMLADDNLNKAKEVVAQLSAPYKDTLKSLSMKIKYLYYLLKDKNEKP